MMFRGIWDSKEKGLRGCEGWVNWDNIMTVERISRDRLSDFGQTVAVPAAIVVLTSGLVVMVDGPDAVRLYRMCELQTRHEPGAMPTLAG